MEAPPIAPGVVALAESNRAALAVDGVLPRYVAAPDSAEEAARFLAWANETGLAVVPRGGGTRMELGNLPRAYDLAISTQRLNRVLEHEPADLTVTVEAGLPIGELQARLRQKGQFLPLDPPAAAGSTIGGVVAANASGPSRLRHGSARDLVIGTRVGTTAGTLARSGGKVVKNVTGYDLNKLYIGSLGTLGLITELTFKVQPLPETEVTLLARFPDRASACRCAYRVLRSPLTPSALELSPIAADPSAGSGPGTALEVGLHAHLAGFRKPVDRMVGDLAGFARAEGALDAQVLDEASAAAAWASLRDGPAPAENGARLIIAVPIGQVVWAAETAEAVAGQHGLTALVFAGAGTGVLRVELGGEGDHLAAIRRLRAEAAERYGWVRVERCPLRLKSELDLLGDAGDSQPIMRRLKEQLDPGAVMSPGRFLGRL
ncbi:MAG TPA: FAD-binding oxidoreductase [Chloroflexota bacterium]|jgi:glycolate oxidase FAD binding subunit|nr:FAD-binding oxidoreductase [Chloroflexota bacterium]